MATRPKIELEALRAMPSRRARAASPKSAPVQAVRAQLAPWQVKLAKELMAKRTDRPLQLAEIAEPLGISVDHFTRGFVNAMGTSPYHWFIRQRISRSVVLLRDTSLSLAEIATECGFSDQSHFTRIFSGHIGVTPGKWRRKIRAGDAASA